MRVVSFKIDEDLLETLDYIVTIDQVDVQRRRGCGRYPTSCIVRDLLNEAGLLEFAKPLRVIDVTYGQGIFWAVLRSKVVVAAVDIKRLDWRVRPRCFIQAAAQKWRAWLREALECLGNQVDIVAVDPPWQKWRRGREPGGRYHYRASRALGTLESILKAGIELAAYLNAPLLYHWREPLAQYEYLAGPVAFRPYFYIINPRAANYRSYFGVVAP